MLMESNLECSSSTETSTDSGTLSAASRMGRKLKQNRSTLWASGQSIIGKNKSIMCKTLVLSQFYLRNDGMLQGLIIVLHVFRKN